MREGVHHRHVGAGQQRQVQLGLDMRRTHQIDASRIQHDQPGALTKPALEERREHRVAVGGIGADDHDGVRLQDRIEMLGAGRSPVGLLEAVARGGMADPRTGVHIVAAEGGPHHLLYGPDLFVGAARRSDGPDGMQAMFGLNGLQARGRLGDGLFPGNFAPGFGNVVPNQRFDDPFRVVRITPGEAPLDAGMAVIGLAELVRHHAHDLVALEFCTERAADAAIGAGGSNAAIRHAFVDHRLLHQRRGRAGLHAGAAGNAFGIEKVFRAGFHDGTEAAPVYGQGVRALYFVTGAYATGADDALGRVETEIRV